MNNSPKELSDKIKRKFTDLVSGDWISFAGINNLIINIENSKDTAKIKSVSGYDKFADVLIAKLENNKLQSSGRLFLTHDSFNSLVSDSAIYVNEEDNIKQFSEILNKVFKESNIESYIQKGSIR